MLKNNLIILFCAGINLCQSFSLSERHQYSRCPNCHREEVGAFGGPWFNPVLKKYLPFEIISEPMDIDTPTNKIITPPKRSIGERIISEPNDDKKINIEKNLNKLSYEDKSLLKNNQKTTDKTEEIYVIYDNEDNDKYPVDISLENNKKTNEKSYLIDEKKIEDAISRAIFKVQKLPMNFYEKKSAKYTDDADDKDDDENDDNLNDKSFKNIEYFPVSKKDIENLFNNSEVNDNSKLSNEKNYDDNNNEDWNNSYWQKFVIVLSQSIPAKNVSKNNKSISSSEEESVSSSEKVESIEFEENINLNRTKKSPSICIHLYDDAKNCGCGSIETNVCDHTDKNCNCDKDVNSQSPSAITLISSETTTAATSATKTTTTTTTTATPPTEEIKIQTEKPHLIGPLFIKPCDNNNNKINDELSINNDCLICGGKKQSDEEDEDDDDKCSCPNKLVYNSNKPPKVIEYDENLYKKFEQKNIEKLCNKTMPLKKNYNKLKKNFTTTEKPKIDEDKLNKLFKEFHMTNEKLNSYLEEQKLQNSNKNFSTIKPIVKQGRSRLYKSGRNKEVSSCDDDNHQHHHHHKTTSRPSSRRISVRSATESSIVTTKKNDNDNSENPGTMKNINLSATDLLNIMKKIENSSSTKTQV